MFLFFYYFYFYNCLINLILFLEQFYEIIKKNKLSNN